MLILPVKSPILRPGDDLSDVIIRSIVLQEGDIVVVSSKAIATLEGAAIDLSKLKITAEAKNLAKDHGGDEAYCQAVLNECKRMRGSIVGGSGPVLLTSVRPHGMKEHILAPAAGLDKSNIADGWVIGWPQDPVASAKKLRADLEHVGGKRLAVLVSDSCCRPGRLGVTAFALSVTGVDPLRSEIGKDDLFGHKLTVTYEATADQLATAANMVMGNASQACPAAIVRDHGLAMTDFCGWVPGIDADKDMFAPILRS